MQVGQPLADFRNRCAAFLYTRGGLQSRNRGPADRYGQPHRSADRSIQSSAQQWRSAQSAGRGEKSLLGRTPYLRDQYQKWDWRIAFGYPTPLLLKNTPYLFLALTGYR